MSLKLITPPASEPVSLAEAKLHCRVDASTDDTLITALIVAAREFCEAYQNRAYVTQTWEASFDNWPPFPVILPRPPLASIVSVKYYDTAGTEATWANTNYYADTDSTPGRVALKSGASLPATFLREINAVKIQYTAGSEAASVSQRVRLAILLLVSYWYSNREAVIVGTISKEIEFAVSALLSMERVVPI